MVCTGDSSASGLLTPTASTVAAGPAAAGSSSAGTPGTPNGGGSNDDASSDVIVNVGGRQRQGRFLVRRRAGMPSSAHGLIVSLIHTRFWAK